MHFLKIETEMFSKHEFDNTTAVQFCLGLSLVFEPPMKSVNLNNSNHQYKHQLMNAYDGQSLTSADHLLYLPVKISKESSDSFIERT